MRESRKDLGNSMRFGLGVCALTVLSVVVTAQPSYAYLDGGTGSMMLQLLLGGLAGLGIGARLYWRRVLDALGIRSDRNDGDRVGHDPDSSAANDIAE